MRGEDREWLFRPEMKKKNMRIQEPAGTNFFSRRLIVWLACPVPVWAISPGFSKLRLSGSDQSSKPAVRPHSCSRLSGLHEAQRARAHCRRRGGEAKQAHFGYVAAMISGSGLPPGSRRQLELSARLNGWKRNCHCCGVPRCWLPIEAPLRTGTCLRTRTNRRETRAWPSALTIVSRGMSHGSCGFCVREQYESSGAHLSGVGTLRLRHGGHCAGHEVSGGPWATKGRRTQPEQRTATQACFWRREPRHRMGGQA